MKKTLVFMTLFSGLLVFTTCKEEEPLGEDGKLFIRFIEEGPLEVINNDINIYRVDLQDPELNGDYITVTPYLHEFGYVVADRDAYSSNSVTSDLVFEPNKGTRGKNGEDKYVDVTVNAVKEPSGGNYSRYRDVSTYTVSPVPTYKKPAGGGDPGGTGGDGDYAIFYFGTNAGGSQIKVTLNGTLIEMSPNNAKILYQDWHTGKPGCETVEEQSGWNEVLRNIIRIKLTQKTNSWTAMEATQTQPKSWSGSFTAQDGCNIIEIK